MSLDGAEPELGCRDYARFDFRAYAAGEIKLLEVNPNPGWCWDVESNLMAEFGGMRYVELLAEVLQRAQDRVRARQFAKSASGKPSRRATRRPL